MNIIIVIIFNIALQFQTISIPTPSRVIGNSRGWGGGDKKRDKTAKIVKGENEARLVFLEGCVCGWGGWGKGRRLKSKKPKIICGTGPKFFLEQCTDVIVIKLVVFLLLFLDPCINILCHTGQECAVVNGIAACVCKQSCPDHEKPVCGSNGMTFPNHCELHRTACLEGKRISIKYNGTCKGQLSGTSCE